MNVHIHSQLEERRMMPAILHGMRGRCPRCGEGKLFRGFLKVNQSCAHCGEELFHHRADDLPPYIAIIIVGHILVGGMLHTEMTMTVAPWVYLVTALPAALILPLAILPSVKGGVVGLQWAARMHGFDLSRRDPALPDDL